MNIDEINRFTAQMREERTEHIEGVCCKEVIVVLKTEGEGTKEDPCRRVREYWTKEGKKIGSILA